MPANWGREIVSLSYLFFLATEPEVRVWSGNGWLDLDADDVDLAGGRYLGAGQLLDPPVVSALINGIAERVEFGLAGAAITSRIVELADEEAASVRGCEAWLGVIGFDAAAQNTEVRWIWNGRADSTQIAFDSKDLTPTRQISLSVGSLFTFRSRATMGYWTSPDQARRSPDDRMFDRVPGLSVEKQKLWPRT